LPGGFAVFKPIEFPRSEVRSPTPFSARFIGRSLLTSLFLASGILHFAHPQPFLRIMPPYLPAPLLLVHISGAAEIAGAIGLAITQVRRVSALGLIALLIALFPANLYMATAHLHFPGIAGQAWFQWARLPMQGLLIWWTSLYARRA
jgi:uncharacterized membrane protein